LKGKSFLELIEVGLFASLFLFRLICQRKIGYSNQQYPLNDQEFAEENAQVVATNEQEDEASAELNPSVDDPFVALTPESSTLEEKPESRPFREAQSAALSSLKEQSQSGIQFMITNKMRNTLVNDLEYLPEEVMLSTCIFIV
jgi:hypothetical protein